MTSLELNLACCERLQVHRDSIREAVSSPTVKVLASSPEPSIDPRRPTSRWPAGGRGPDVIVPRDPTKPPTHDNIEAVIEIKPPGLSR